MMEMDFDRAFYKKVAKARPSWLVRGILSVDDLVYGFGTDTKILSRAFELLAYPFIEEIAEENGYEIEPSIEQTVYPDFTLYANRKSKNKIAIDIKSTYRKGKNSTLSFTLGSYTSFLRNNTKNIAYPYDQYKEHWIIGFVYDRTTAGSRSSEIVSLSSRAKMPPPFKNVEFFVQEKYKIAGTRPGSGNTANIGSIAGNINDFRLGKGPFAKLGERAFRDYWANYGRFKPRPYADLRGYTKWKRSKK